MITFNACHNETDKGFDRIEWPDGKSFMEQENLVVEMFSLIQNEFEKAKRIIAKREADKIKRKRSG